MRALLATVTLAALFLAGAILLADSTEERAARPQRAPDSRALRPVPGSQLSDAQINRQDSPDASRQRDEARAHDRRPLLNALPVTLHGVTFDIGGLAADDRTTIIRADARGLGRGHARVAFQSLERMTGDRSRSYRLQVTP